MAEPATEALADDSRPGRAHRVLGGRVRDDRRRPFRGVDLRHQRRIDQACLVVKPIVGPAGVLTAQPVADCVVLECEQGVEEGQPDPEVARHPAEVDQLLELARGQTVRADAELAVLAGADRRGEALVGAVDLRAVPPMAVGGDEGVRRARILVRGRVAPGARDRHRTLGPVVVVVERQLIWILLFVLSVAEPVVDLELDPCGRQHVERGGRQKALAREQLAADRPRIRLEHRRFRPTEALSQRNVAAEAGADAAHQRALQVVQGSVDAAPRAVRGVAGLQDQLGAGRGQPGIGEIALPQPVANPDQGHHAERRWKAIPAEAPVDPVRERHEGSREHGGHRCRSSRATLARRRSRGSPLPSPPAN